MLPFRVNKHKNIFSKKPIVVGVVFLLITLIFMNVASIRTSVQGIVVKIFLPVYRLENAIGWQINSVRGYFSSKKDLLLETEVRKNTIAEFDSFRMENIVLRNENENLKKILGRNVVTHKILATVLYSKDVSVYESLLLDVGSKDGVKKGDIVLSGSIALGTIDTVFDSTSLVKLFSASKNNFQGLLVDNGTVLDVKGVGGGTFEFVVPRGMNIQNAMVLAYPAYHSYPIAQVGGIVSNEHESFKKTLARVPFNISSLHFVYVETEQSK